MKQLALNRKTLPRRGIAVAAAGIISATVCFASAAQETEKSWSGSFTVTLPPQGGIEKGTSVLQKYAADERWETKLVADSNGDPKALQLFIPSPLQGSGQTAEAPTVFEVDSYLPRRPQWYIYRFNYLELAQDTANKMPFKYVEVDWNTEDLPRGPNGSFTSPHYDFHFYTKSQDYVKENIGCESAGKTCDFTNSTTDEVERFFDMPSACFLPDGYFPDVDSSIPEMGLHMLDSRFEYTVDNVNHNPVIIYGTFNDQIVFLEASLTLFAFQDAVDAAEQGGRLSWPVRQPEKYQYAWWPQTITLEYRPEQDVFVYAYEDFAWHDTSQTCEPS